MDWLRYYNADFEPEHRVAFYGLDLYSLHRSIGQVLEYLREVDPETAKIAAHRYGCLTPWQSDPAAYGQAALNGTYKSCELQVGRILNELRKKQREYTPQDGGRYFDALQNAKLVVNAEEYYRVMYYGSRASWNLRDGHMFSTLNSLLDFHGNHSKAIVWRTTLTLETQTPRKCHIGGKSILGSFAATSLVINVIPSVSERIRARLLPHRNGTDRWKRRKSCRRCFEVMNDSFTSPDVPNSCFPCDSPGQQTCGINFWSPDCSARLV